MVSLWLLATEEGGFGLEFNLLESNLINLVIIWGVLFYFGSKFLGGNLSARRNNIKEAIQDAERRQREAQQSLEEQKKNLTQAQAKAKEIVELAKQNATKVSEDILAQAQADIERMRAAADQDVSFQQEKVMRELRQRISELALARAETELPSRLNPEIQTALVDKSIALLEG
ncbi:MAG: F0F1 ATP synthase subunit B [Cyanobacteria bacterium P01_C01_bin.70]